MKHLLMWLVACLPGLVLAADPEVRVAQRLVPDTQVMVGGTVSLEVDLLVDTWFTDAPVLPALVLPGAVVQPPAGEAQHLNQQIAGKPFFGLRYTYQITPQAAQRYQIPALSFQVSPGQASGPVTVSSQPLSFEAKGSVGKAGSEQPVAQALRFTQAIEQSHTPLRVGDSITRRLRLEAPGAQAMLLRPPALAEVEGLKRYLQSPSVKPLSDGRGGILGGQREDTATYVVVKAGKHRLPAIDYQWRDATTGEVRHVRVPEVVLEATAVSYKAPFSISDDLRALGHDARIRIGGQGLLLVACLLAFAVLAWTGRARGIAAWRQVQAWRARLRQARLDSPGYAWKLARQQCARQPAQLDALYLWQRRSSGEYTLSAGPAQIPGVPRDRLLAYFKSRYADTPAAKESSVVLARQAPAGQQRHLRTRHGLKPLNP
ncbi:BatD family protein [Pseudomonas putida]|uniref:BatD family protein n=1 Tax=Pseudomonas putida TaxID=303 RepID=UPI00300F1E7C